MAKKTVCDICDKECSANTRYQLIYKCMIRTTKEDICLNYFREIRNIIREKNKSI